MAWTWKDDDPKIVFADPSMFYHGRHSRHDADDGFKRWVRRELTNKKKEEEKKKKPPPKEMSVGQCFAVLTLLCVPMGLLYFYLAAITFAAAVQTLQAVLK